jgi:hypothetical protein
LLVKAWLERRALEGLEPAFRASIRDVDDTDRRGAESLTELHMQLDDVLADAGLIPRRRNDR